MTRPLVLAGARVVQVDVPGMEPTDPVDITVERGRIASIGPHRTGRRVDGATVVDVDGRFVVPGLVNAHDHLYSKELRDPGPGMDIRAKRQQIDARSEASTLATMLRNAWRSMATGVLVVRDLGARHGLNTELAAVIAEGTTPGPVVVAAGRPIVMTGGHVHTFGREADGPDECRKAVREQRKAGAKVIKVMASGGLSNFPHEDYTVCEFVDDELLAITAEARKLGMPTCAHAFGTDAVAAAIRCGIDSIEHGVHLDEATVAEMAAKGTSYVPTMANMARIASPDMNDRAGVPERATRFAAEIVEPQRASVAMAIEAGIRVGVGTDSTGVYDEELAALMAAGMDPERVIRAATIDGAGICRVDAGVVREGRLALLGVHDVDPRPDPLSWLAPAAVVSGGRWFDRGQLDALAGDG